MGEIVYSAAPELRSPGRFCRAAAADLRAGLPIGWRLFRSNLRVRYRRSWFGYVWLLLPALGTAAIAAFVQSQRIVGLGETELPYPAFVLAGMILWQVFVEALNAPLQQLQAGRQLLTRSQVPHEALILAGLFELMLNAAVRLIVLAAALAVLGVAFHATLLLVPLAALSLALLGLAVGLAVAPLGMLYDDVSRAMTLGLGFAFFLTPILYPIAAGSPLRFNPLAPALENARQWIAGDGAAPGFFLVTAASAALLVLAWLFYRLARPHFISRLG
ncbi:MAG TPA: ABC transporter permease [Allosphingosinicella sp.]|jgi:lipopolysaccharide transport system permease protein